MTQGTRRLLDWLPTAVLCAALAGPPAARSQGADPALPATPQAAVDELLAADRAFSAASAKTDLVSGLAAMFDADVIMPLPNGQFAEGARIEVDVESGNFTFREIQVAEPRLVLAER